MEVYLTTLLVIYDYRKNVVNNEWYYLTKGAVKKVIDTTGLSMSLVVSD